MAPVAAQKRGHGVLRLGINLQSQEDDPNSIFLNSTTVGGGYLINVTMDGGYSQG